MEGSQVADKLAVAETVYRYAIGLDTKDFDLYRSIFADEIHADFSSYSGRPGGTMPADDWVTGLTPLFTGLHATQHTMTNPLAQIVGERATCRMYMQAHHVLSPDNSESWFTIGGYYDDELIRSDRGPDGWLLTEVKLTVLWTAGDPDIMAAARAAGRGR